MLDVRVGLLTGSVTAQLETVPGELAKTANDKCNRLSSNQNPPCFVGTTQNQGVFLSKDLKRRAHVKIWGGFVCICSTLFVLWSVVVVELPIFNMNPLGDRSGQSRSMAHLTGINQVVVSFCESPRGGAKS